MTTSGHHPCSAAICVFFRIFVYADTEPWLDLCFPGTSAAFVFSRTAPLYSTMATGFPAPAAVPLSGQDFCSPGGVQFSLIQEISNQKGEENAGRRRQVRYTVYPLIGRLRFPLLTLFHFTAGQRLDFRSRSPDFLFRQRLSICFACFQSPWPDRRMKQAFRTPDSRAAAALSSRFPDVRSFQMLMSYTFSPITRSRISASGSGCWFSIT